MPDYFSSSENKASDKGAREVLTNKIHNEFSDVFAGIVCFEGMFILQLLDGSQPYEVPPRREAYTL